MNEILIIFGSIILACIVTAIPALTVLSICLSWYGGIQASLIVLTFWDVIILAGCIKDYGEYVG